MYGFTKVNWTDHKFAAFVKKHDLFHTSGTNLVEWKRQGCHPLVHAVVIYDNSETTRDIWVNDTFLNGHGLCGYLCFYGGEQHEVYAETQLAAHDKALEHFKEKYKRRKIKSWDVSAVIVENADGTLYAHSTASF